MTEVHGTTTSTMQYVDENKIRNSRSATRTNGPTSFLVPSIQYSMSDAVSIFTVIQNGTMR